MTGLELNAGAMLAVIRIINPEVLLHKELNIRFDLSYFSCFIVSFVRLELFFLCIIFFLNFSSENE